MKGNVFVIVGVVALLAAARVDAQPPGLGRYIDPDRGISLEDAIALALQQEPALRAARTEIDAAAGRKHQAGLRANPQISVERRWEPGGTDNQTSLGVQLPLELFRRHARLRTAEQELAVARHEVADRERRLAGEVRERYGEALAAIRELDVLDELRAAVKHQLELTAARVTEGATPPLERDLIDVEVRRLRADHTLQTGRVDIALLALRRALGIPASEPLALRERLEAVVARSSLPSGGGLSTGSFANSRPDVLAAEARVRAAAARVDEIAREGRFDVSLVGGYMRMDAGFPQLGFAPGGALERVRGVFNYVAGGAMVTVPLFNRNQGAVAAARAQRQGTEAARDAAVLDAGSELATARIEDATAREVVAQYRDGAQRLARQNLDVVGQTFQLGRATVFDVLAEQRRYLDVERAFTDALRFAFEARTRLRLALGDVR